MRQLTCEMCGSTDLIKQDGVFVCQSCGTKYSVEEAKKMMVEGTVEVTGTVKVDNSAAITSYLKMAQSALEASNHKEAEDYANKIIELDPKHSEAWLIKGEAAGWQSSAANARLTDAVTAWLNAIEYVTDADRSAIRETISNKYTHLMLAMISLRCKNFGTIHNTEHKENVKSEISNCISLMNRLMTEGGVSFNRAIIYNQIARSLNEAAVAGFKDAQNDFGPEHINMSKWQWERFTASCDCCTELLAPALEYTRDISFAQTICDNLITIEQSARDSSSWKFDVNSWTFDHYVQDYSFTKSAKDFRTKKIDNWREKKSNLDSGIKQKVLNSIRGGRTQEEENLARTQYWEEHSVERATLSSEQDSLSTRMQQISSEIGSLPIISEIKQQQAKIDELGKRLSGLGLFKGKEKKALQAQIESEKNRLHEFESRKKQEEEPLLSEMSNLQNRISEITSEFTKSRGRISTVADRFIFQDAVRDGKITVTPNMVFEYISKLATDEYQPNIEEASPSPFAEWGKAWMITFKNPNLPQDKQNVGVSIFLYAETSDSPISTIVLPAQRGETSIADFCKEASYILIALSEDKSLSRDDVEDSLCDLILDENQSLFVIDKFKVEYAAYFLEALGITIPLAYGVIRVDN